MVVKSRRPTKRAQSRDILCFLNVTNQHLISTNIQSHNFQQWEDQSYHQQVRRAISQTATRYHTSRTVTYKPEEEEHLQREEL